MSGNPLLMRPKSGRDAEFAEIADNDGCSLPVLEICLFTCSGDMGDNIYQTMVLSRILASKSSFLASSRVYLNGSTDVNFSGPRIYEPPRPRQPRLV